MGEKRGFKMFLCSTVGRAVMIVVFYGIILGIVLTMFTMLEDAMVPLWILFGVLGIFGWKALSRITPDIFLIMPIGGWVIYFIVKGLLAVVVGTFTAPFVIARMITNAIQGSISEDM